MNYAFRFGSSGKSPIFAAPLKKGSITGEMAE